MMSSSLKNPCVEAAMVELTACGITPLVRHTGKHVALVWSRGDGVERTFVTSATPSDFRAPLNSRTEIRRMLREDGLIVTESAALAGDKPRLFLQSGSFVCSSRDVCAHFSKQHKNVLRDIDRILEDLGPDFGRLNFEPSSYVNEQGKQQRSFTLSRDGFTLLAMGFSGSEAIVWKVRYLEAFNAMEAELRLAIPSLPGDVVTRIERIEGDLSALIDLSLSMPQPEPGFVIIKAHKRRMRVKA
jgi:Rha family phage regulatory protein